MAKEEEKSFGAEIPISMIEQFQDQAAERGYYKKRAVLAMVRLWLSLPQSVQYDLLAGEDPKSLETLIRSIVRDEKKGKK